MRLILFLLAFSFLQVAGFSQNIEKDWVFSSIENKQGTSIVPTYPDEDVFQLEEGSFYSLAVFIH